MQLFPVSLKQPLTLLAFLIQLADNVTPEAWIHVAQLVGTLIAVLISLKIRLEQAKVKEELVEKQQEVKDELIERHEDLKNDFNEKHEENKEALSDHIIEDKTILGDVKASLARIEARQKHNSI